TVRGLGGAGRGGLPRLTCSAQLAAPGHRTGRGRAAFHSRDGGDVVPAASPGASTSAPRSRPPLRPSDPPGAPYPPPAPEAGPLHHSRVSFPTPARVDADRGRSICDDRGLARREPSPPIRPPPWSAVRGSAS